MPHARGDTVNLRKIASVLAILFAVYFVVNSPKDAADIVKSTQHIVAQGFTSMSEFVKNL
jgi:hypothetical protein